MAQTKTDRLCALGMAPELAKEVSTQMDAVGMDGTAPTVADAAAAPTQAEYNALLAALRARGVIA